MTKLSELKISPAPWKVVDSYQFPKGGEWVSVIEASNKKTVSVPTFYNARFIEASPKLYEALYDMVVMYRDGGSYEYEQEVISKAKAALAEAAGEEVHDE